MLSDNGTTNIIWNFHDELIFTRTQFLIDSPLTVFSICTLYLLFVLKLGPQMMKNRPPFLLNTVMTVFNAVQLCFSAYIVYKGAPVLWKIGLKPQCLYDRDVAIDYQSTIHWYFLFKIVELSDTVFFILRKKFRQASFLHVYHHTYVVLFVWSTIRFDPSYSTLFPGTLNSFVHVVMYSYYGLSTFPKLAKYLWWKKYITVFQLVQFVIIIWHMVRCYHTAECPPSFALAYGKIINCMLFLILFLDFYTKSYKKPSMNKPNKNIPSENMPSQNTFSDNNNENQISENMPSKNKFNNNNNENKTSENKTKMNILSDSNNENEPSENKPRKNCDIRMELNGKIDCKFVDNCKKVI